MIKRNRYPILHVAESTVNRLMNIANQVQPRPSATIPPPMPDVTAESDALNAQLATPPAPAGMPVGADGAVQDAILQGGDPIAAAVSPLTEV